MGGGSVSFSWSNEKSQDDFNEKRYNAEVNYYLDDKLSDYNNRDVTSINAHLDTLINAINKDIGGNIKLLLGGSIKKYTYVDGLSDVDVLAIINSTDLENKTPNEIMNILVDKIQQRLPSTDIKKGKLAVTVTFSDGCQIQVLPSTQTETGVKIATQTGDKWSNVIKPDSFATKLTQVNQKNAGGVVPVIKLYKAINKNQQEKHQLSGYHIESIAIEAFENYTGPKTRKAMLMHLTQYATTAVLQPIRDSTGQSLHVDSYLGASNSVERRKVSSSIKRINNRMTSADQSQSTDQWRDIINE